MSLAPRGQDDEGHAEGRGRPPSAGEPAAEAGGGADDPGGGEEIHRPGDRVSAADELQAAGLAGPISLRAKPDSSNTISRTRIAGLSWAGLGDGIGLDSDGTIKDEERAFGSRAPQHGVATDPRNASRSRWPM